MQTERYGGPWGRPWAMVEIAGSVAEGERVELIRAVYRSSRSRTIALALRGVSRQSVDRALDGVVDARTDQRGGVVYLDASELHDDVVTAACRATIVLTTTDAFRCELQKHGINAIPLEDGARLLAQSPTEPQPGRDSSCGRI